MRTKLKIDKSLTQDRLLIAIIFISIFTMAVRFPLDTDTWWHLRVGAWMLVETKTTGLWKYMRGPATEKAVGTPLSGAAYGRSDGPS